MTYEQFDRLQLALFSGKGGVGKTTLSCGFARYWARRFPDDRVLLVSTDPAHSLGDVLLFDVADEARSLADLPNLFARALDARALLLAFKERYGDMLEVLVERGSFVDGEDLTPAWDLSWPGLDELMGILEIQRVLAEGEADRVVVDMAPSGHSLNLFGMMDFLDSFTLALDGFQEKHRVMMASLSGKHYTPDAADGFIEKTRTDLNNGRALLQDPARTACVAVAIAEPMSLLETKDFLGALETLTIPAAGTIVNRLLPLAAATTGDAMMVDRLSEQQELLVQFQAIAADKLLLGSELCEREPVGAAALDAVAAAVRPLEAIAPVETATVSFPEAIRPGLPDFLAEGKQVLLVGGKGGVGKTTVAASMAWGLHQRYPERSIRVISIDPAHSLGDAFGITLGHEAQAIDGTLSGQEIDSETLLDEFRENYLWELADMMSGGDALEGTGMELAYGPESWRQMVSQSLPGIDEMLALLAVMELLESGDLDLVIVDTAPTGHLLRFLEMPLALSEWLSWIFKLWIKYQDIAGHPELMGRLRQLRKRVVNANKTLQDYAKAEFIGVAQAQSAIWKETDRLSRALQEKGVAQRFLVHNRYDGTDFPADAFPGLKIAPLPALPRCVSPQARIAGAATLLFVEQAAALKLG